MRLLILSILLTTAVSADARTIVESRVGPEVTVTVKRINDSTWVGRIRYQTFDSSGLLISDQESEVSDELVPVEDRATVVQILNRTWTNLHGILAIPTATPSP
jgi:hypothetical protein